MAYYPLPCLLLLLCLSLCLQPYIFSLAFDFPAQIMHENDDGSVELKLPLIHRNSPSSPLHDGSASRLKQFENAMQRSLDRAVSIFSKISPNNVESKRKNCGGDEGNYFSPLAASSEGDYVTTLSFGTPPQTFTTLFADTGSTLVWVKCSNSSHSSGPTQPNEIAQNHIHKFLMNNSHSKKLGRSVHLFEQNRSSTYTHLSCRNPICRQVQNDSGLQDASCNNTSSSPCRFQYMYVDLTGSTGEMAVDNLNLNKVGSGMEKIKDFVFGCASQTQGIHGDGGVGLDRGSYSLVSQLGPRIGYKFSYCLTSAALNASSSIFFGKSAALEGRNVMYTPLINPNNTGRNAYYLGVRRISLGGRRIPVPSQVFQIRRGSGGTVIDSGTTFVLLATPAYQALVLTLLLTVPYPQVFFTSLLQGVPCYDISSARGNPNLPNLTFHLRGGARLEIPWQNIFFLLGNNVVCMSVQQSPNGVTDLSIIGNRAQQNFHFLYDLKNNRLGFVRRNCSEVQ